MQEASLHFCWIPTHNAVLYEYDVPRQALHAKTRLYDIACAAETPALPDLRTPLHGNGRHGNAYRSARMAQHRQAAGNPIQTHINCHISILTLILLCLSAL